MLASKGLQCVDSYISQIIKWAGALGEAWWRKVQGRRGCADGCAAVKGWGRSQVLVLRLGFGVGWGHLESWRMRSDMGERLTRGMGAEVGRLVDQHGLAA